MTAPTPEQRAAWRADSERYAGHDPEISLSSRVLALLDALDAAERPDNFHADVLLGKLRQSETKLRAAEAALARVEALAEEWGRDEDRTWISTLGNELRAALNGANA